MRAVLLVYNTPSIDQENLLTNRGRDIFLQGKSGTGKTSGVLIAALNNIVVNNSQPQCLIFCASFDSAFETHNLCTNLIDLTGLNIRCSLVSKNVIEGENIEQQHAAQILIGTPHEMIAALREGAEAHITEVYLDDADVYATMDKMSALLAKLPLSIRLVCLSRSTNLKAFDKMEQWSHAAKYFSLSIHDLFNSNIKSFFITMPDQAANSPPPESKYDILKYICHSVEFGQIIVFCLVW